jgi:hypothetical protein
MPDEKTGGAARRGGYALPLEKHQQLLHRHAPSFIHHVLDAFRERTLNAPEAAEQLGVSPSRLYALSTERLRAHARKQASHWIPGLSGGDHSPPWPQPVLDLLRKKIGSDGRVPIGTQRRRVEKSPGSF